MEQFNQFVFSLNNRMQHLPPEVRQRRLKTIIDDVEVLPNGEESCIFTPLETLWDDEIELTEELEEIATENDLDRKNRIKELRAFYSTMTEGEEEAEEELEYSIKIRCGKNDMHDAVMMGDLDLIRRLYNEGVDPMKRNNNGHTAVYLAFLEENEKVIALFRQLGVIPSQAAA